MYIHISKENMQGYLEISEMGNRRVLGKKYRKQNFSVDSKKLREKRKKANIKNRLNKTQYMKRRYSNSGDIFIKENLKIGTVERRKW